MAKTPQLTVPDQKIARAKAAIDTNFALPWTAPALARSVGITTIDLHVGFKRLLGKSAMHYLADIRIRAAGELLIAGNTVTDTARACGFRTPAALSAQFFRHTGIHASHYRFQMVGWKNGPAAIERRALIAR